MNLATVAIHDEENVKVKSTSHLMTRDLLNLKMYRFHIYPRSSSSNFDRLRVKNMYLRTYKIKCHSSFKVSEGVEFTCQNM